MYPRSIYLDVEILAEAIHLLEKGLDEAGTQMDARWRGKIIALLYERIMRADRVLDQARIDSFIKALVNPGIEGRPPGVKAGFRGQVHQNHYD